MLIRLLRESGRFDEALAEASSATALESGAADVALERALVHQALHQPAQAKVAVASALAIEPYHVESHMLNVELSLVQGDAPAAAESIAWIDQLAPVDYRVQMRVVLLQMETGQFPQAISRLLRVKDLEPSDPEPQALLADAHLELGNAAMGRRDLEAARSHYEKAVVYRPDLIPAQGNRAMVLIELGDYAAAEGALAALVELQPNDPAVRLTYGDILGQNGKMAKARAQWQQVVRETQGRPELKELRDVARSRL